MKSYSNIRTLCIMFFYGVSKLSSTRSYSLSSSLVRNVRRSTALFQVADYAGIAGRVVTTPESRWDVLAVGVIVSPYSMKFDTPKQATISRHDGGAQAGSIKLFPGYEECISNLDGFDFIWVITYMHLNSGFKKKIRPMPREGAENQPPPTVGLFASRAPHRPNPIALSALQVTSIDVPNGIIHVLGLDLLDGTPVLDVKPYIPAFDSFPTARAGWMDDISVDVEKSRKEGYQNIISNRGARAARAHDRKTNEKNGNVGVVGGEGRVGEGEGVEGNKKLEGNNVPKNVSENVLLGPVPEGSRARRRRENKEKKERELELYGVDGKFPVRIREGKKNERNVKIIANDDNIVLENKREGSSEVVEVKELEIEKIGLEEGKLI